jgi:hypothetical protein
MLGSWYIFFDRELLVAYAITICMVAVVAYITRRIWLEADPHATGLMPGLWAQNSEAGDDEKVNEYPQSGVPGRWQWRSE